MPVRSPEQLLASAHTVIDEAFRRGAEVMAPLFSGGYDSRTAVYAASLHPRFDGHVYHIKTGIGSAATFAHVEEVCAEHGWKLLTFESPSTYEMFVRERGFPGPGVHQWAYNRLKERCVRQIGAMHVKRTVNKKGAIRMKRKNIALITGCRLQESDRRMGSVEALKIGEISPTTGKVSNKARYWTAPCYDWSAEEQRAFMEFYDLPRNNPIKESPIGMSGECFCGAFARPNEIEMIRKYAPDVAVEIDRLTVIAKECGKHSVWGTRPDRKKGVVVAQTGPLCNSCDARAMAAGIIIDSTCERPTC